MWLLADSRMTIIPFPRSWETCPSLSAQPFVGPLVQYFLVGFGWGGFWAF
jgi:hypothetical protein